MKLLNKIFVFGSLAIMGAFLCLVGYWLLYPYNPLDITQPVEVNPKIYHVGERLGLSLDFCSHMSVPVTTNAYFVLKGLTTDHIIGATPTKVSQSTVACRKVVSNTYVILSDFIPGSYHLEIKASYQVNPLRSVLVEISSQEFEVTK